MTIKSKLRKQFFLKAEIENVEHETTLKKNALKKDDLLLTLT